MELNKATHFERGSNLTDLYESIQSEDFTFIDARYKYKGNEDFESIIFWNNKLVFKSSKDVVLFIKSAGNGVSGFFPPSMHNELEGIDKLRLKTIDHLPHSDMYVVRFTKPARLIRALREVDEARKDIDGEFTTELSEFFKSAQEYLEMVIDDCNGK